MALFNSEDYIKKVMASENIDDCPKVPLPKIDPQQNYIFISYSHKDYKQVFCDLALMYEKGVRFWYDYDLSAGKYWNREAFRKIRDPHCSGVIFYLSENLFLSRSVIEEIRITLGVDDDNQPIDSSVNYFSVNLTDCKPSDIIYNARSNMSDGEWNAKGYDHDWNVTLPTAFRDKATYVKYNIPDHNDQLITQIKKNFNVMDDELNKNGQYEGEMLNGKRQGYGKAVYDNGSVYEGYWENNQRHGKGKLIFGQSSKDEFFEGTFVDDVIEGYGIYQLKNGTRYEGNFTNGKVTGDFTVNYNNGQVYVGQLVNAKRHGRGKLIYKKDDVRDYYEGDWDNGNFHGQGIAAFKSGAKYTGEFASNQYNGKGRYDYAEDSFALYYEGEYKNGKPEGHGIIKYTDDTTWEGIWKEGAYQTGEGTARFSDGKKYKGKLEEGKFEGNGILVFPNGAKYTGEFKDGKMHGKGEFVFAKNAMIVSYKGDFYEGKEHGLGTLIFNNGDVYEGCWVNGKRHGFGVTTYAMNNKLIKCHKGTWIDNQMRFYGEYHKIDGVKLTGMFEQGVLNGPGATVSKNGVEKRVTWKNGMIVPENNKTTQRLWNSMKKTQDYVGEEKNGVPEGFGVLNYSDGSVYTGAFKDGKYHGTGEFIDKNGISYLGGFENGVLNEKCIINEGSWIYVGECVNNKMHGEGMLQIKFLMYKGKFENHKPIGEGYLTNTTGKKYKFIDGVCVDKNATGEIKNFFKTKIMFL